MRALVTGATGFIGQQLIKQLDRPVVLTRNVDHARSILKDDDITFYSWNPSEDSLDLKVFDGVDTIFHLAGEPIANGRWSVAKKKRIFESRVVGTRHLVAAMKTVEQPPTLICCSAIGYYGPRGEEHLDETSSPGDDFLADLCKQWEEEAAVANEYGGRVVSVRVGVVLGTSGGALKKMLTPFRCCLGGRLGNGRQWMSWVHLDDVVGIMQHAASNANMHGKFNAVAPGVVRNSEFTKTLAKVLGRPAVFPVPAFMLRLMLGELACLLLDSQYIQPTATLSSGYEFQYPDLLGALENLL